MGAHNGADGLNRQAGQHFDAVILDLMLPDMDGLDVCRTLRADSDIPVLMLTAKGDPMDRVVGLEIGADDYLPKPFEPRELLARVRALLRRSQSGPDDQPGKVHKFGRLELDPGSMVARLDGEACDITSHQFRLLMILASAPGRIQSRDMLMDKLKGQELDVFDRSIDVHISRIRAAIEDDAKNPKRIVTVRGEGYVFARDQA